jgi:hypothetical protein
LLDFILSKMNLLLLATAIFAIIAFFTVGLIERTTSNEAVVILDRLVKKSNAMANSSVYCDSFLFNLPSSIDVSGENYYYVIKISKSTRTINEEEFNELIFSIISRKEFKRKELNAPAIAAKSFLTKANLELYSFWDWESGQTPNFDTEPEYAEFVFLDPQEVIPLNSVYFVKEVFKGKTIFHVIPCNIDFDEIAKNKVGINYYADNSGGGVSDGRGFNC